jgi:hypothetical protein
LALGYENQLEAAMFTWYFRMTFWTNSTSLFGRFITEDVEKTSPDKTNRQQTDGSEHSRGGAKTQMYRIINAFTTDLAM